MLFVSLILFVSLRAICERPSHRAHPPSHSQYDCATCRVFYLLLSTLPHLSKICTNRNIRLSGKWIALRLPKGHKRLPRRIQHQLSIVVLATLAFVGVIICLDRALPPNLSRLNDLSLVIEDRNGRPIHVAPTDTGGYRLPVSIQQVDRRYIDMLVKYEDKRFFQHPGVDPFALFRAVGQWITKGRVISGGSTLTMQTARLLETRPRTITAKLAEILRAIQLERRFTKNEILEMYMTLAPFGGRIDSVRAASLAYFGQEPKYLTDAQAALLVVLPQAPSRLRPDRHPEKATAARAKVLSRVGLKAAEDFVSPVPTQQRSFPRLARQLAQERRDIKGIVKIYGLNMCREAGK